MGPDLPLALDAASDAVPVGARRDPFAFIDLARLGRTDWRSGGNAFLQLLGWQIVVALPVGVALYVKGDALPDGFFDVVVLATATLGWILGLRGVARKAHRRPLLSLVSIDGRLDLRRIALGAGFWVLAYIAVTAGDAAFHLLAHPAADAGPVMDELSAPPSRALVLAGLLSIALFPLQAGCEELVFRGWLTQTLGQALRWRWLLVLVVALAFALAHAPYDGPFIFPTYVIMSLGFSALTLRDQRVELAIGVHAANNIFVVLASVFLSDPAVQRHTLFLGGGPVPWWAVPEAAIQFALIYWMACWFMRRGAR
jgi:membrane protease YdiL (CAAX protease family)